MTPQNLDMVVLERDLPAHGLTRGDLGAVVDQVGPDAYMVEFVAGSWRTQALVTLEAHDIMAVSGDGVLSVRSSHAIAS
jgi:hypothetical protein